jgi:AcrR family transcriptional regulator
MSTQQENRRRVLPEAERKEMILDAALEVFAKHGYESSDVDDIARLAGIGKGTIYRHFDSKQNLFLALVDRGYQMLCQRMAADRDPNLSFEKKLIRGMRSHVDFFIQNPQYYRVLMLELPDHRLQIGEDILKRHQRYTQPMVKAIAAATKEGELKPIDPDLAALTLGAMACIVVERHLRGKRDTVSRDIKTAIDLFLRGAKK